MDTGGLVLILTFQALESLGCADVGHAATREVTLLYSCPGSIEGILYTVLLLLHLNLGGSAHIKDSHAACELAETLLKFLPVIVGGRGSNLLPDEVSPLLDILLAACTAYDGGILLGDGHLLGLSEHIRSSVLEGESPFLGNEGRTGKGGDILKHLLAAVSEARSLHCSYLDGAAEPVHHEGGKSLAVNILGNDEE